MGKIRAMAIKAAKEEVILRPREISIFLHLTPNAG
jgi:hypothetical protein